MNKKYRNNIKLYSIYKVLTKRVYLASIVVYMLEVGKLDIKQIALLTSIGAATSIASEFPTGHFADKHGKKKSIIIGAFIISLSPLLMAFYPKFPGFVLSTICFSLGMGFINGAGEAMMHDTLEKLGIVDQYTKIMSRAQSNGLLGNVVLSALVPLTYGINKKLPFILGFVASLYLVRIGNKFTEVPKSHNAKATQVNILKSLRLILTKRTWLFFVVLGILSASWNSIGSLINAGISQQGLNSSYFGIMYAASSLFGIVMGRYFHILKRFKASNYLIFEAGLLMTMLCAIGVFQNLWVTVGCFVFIFPYWRFKSIIVQAHALDIAGNRDRKASVISTISLSSSVNELWLPVALAAGAAGTSIFKSFTYFGLTVFVLTVIFGPLSIFVAKRRA